MKSGNLLTLAGSKYVLLEFPYNKEVDIDEICYNAMVCGYTPVVAHVERYSYANSIGYVEMLRRHGAVIQVNAGTVTGASRIGSEKFFVRRLLKLGLVDVVASDFHYTRRNVMLDAYNFIDKKYDGIAHKLFYDNPMKIINNEKW